MLVSSAQTYLRWFGSCAFDLEFCLVSHDEYECDIGLGGVAWRGEQCCEGVGLDGVEDFQIAEPTLLAWSKVLALSHARCPT